MRRTKIKNDFELTMLTIPGILCLIIFNYIPMAGIVIAFKNYKPLKGIFASEWVGFENFRFFFESADAVRTIRNTMLYGAWFIVIGTIAGVTLAIMFYFLRSRVALKVYNSIVLLPKFMSIVMVAFIVYALLNPSQGLINMALKRLGGSEIQWYANPKYWPYILSFVYVWMSAGMSSVIYYASLVGMDESLMEAADIDGALLHHKIMSVLLPHLKSLIIIQIILAIGSIFNGDFGLFYQVPQNVGVLYPTTDIITTYTYRALQEGDLAKSAAVGLFQSAAGCTMVILTNLVVRKISPEDSLF